MTTLHEAMTIARTAQAHPLTATVEDDCLHYDWSCPEGCAPVCPVQNRIRVADHLELFDRVGPGQYLIVPGLWGVHVVRTDGSELP